jgi:glyceraldehyde 3-phosphate dehydrogenase
MKKIGINGFGRIGRYLTRLALQKDGLEIGLVNDLADIQTLCHLLKYDSVHGVLPLDFSIEGQVATFSNGKKLTFSSCKNPDEIPWSSYEVETVAECSGLFLTREKASKHFVGGAKRVILSAPAGDDTIPSVVLGVNEEILNEPFDILSNASCTTNNTAPMIKVLRGLGEIELGYINTVHSYTSDQRLHDAPHKDLRRARSAGQSIVPTSTGAAKAVVKIFPELKGKITGSSMRVPVPNGSVSEITVLMKNELTVSEINQAMKKATEGELKGILGYTTDPIVSVDIIGNPLSVLFDAELTSVLGKLVKITGWYDNEAGYSNRLFELLLKVA